MKKRFLSLLLAFLLTLSWLPVSAFAAGQENTAAAEPQQLPAADSAGMQLEDLGSSQYTHALPGVLTTRL